METMHTENIDNCFYNQYILPPAVINEENSDYHTKRNRSEKDKYHMISLICGI